MQSSQAGKTKLPLHALLFAAGGLTALGLVGGAMDVRDGARAARVRRARGVQVLEPVPAGVAVVFPRGSACERAGNA
jgi:hypothetical protein